MMRVGRFAVLALLAMPTVALAQGARPPESVTVTGTRSRQVLENFVQSLAAPTRLTGKMARWEDGVCPTLVGLRREFASFVVNRLKNVAAKAGAPVNAKANCTPNIAIVFTTAPQALLDNVKKNQPGYLGYYDNKAQRDALATVTRPIQAWYTTATRDLRGNIQVDGAKTVGTGMEITYACPPPQEGMCTLHLSNAHGVSVTGSRLGDGMRSTLYNVVIVANPVKLTEYEMGTLGDYIAMLALTQVASPDTCQKLPSIVNLLAKDCAQKADALTENDLAYLRGLYKAAPDQTLGTQQDQIAYQMEQELKGR